MNRLFLITFFFVLSFSSVFSQQNLEKSILWEIQGNGLKSPSYLLGTFHMVCVADLKLQEKVEKAIQDVDQIVLEVNLTDPKEMENLQELMFSSVSLSSQLNEAEQVELKELLLEKYNISLTTVDYLAPIGLMGLMAMKVIPCEVKGYDMEVLEVGVRQNKRIGGLEHFKDQVEITSSFYTAKEILTQLKLEDDFEENYHHMATAFQQEDIEALYQSATDPLFMSEEGKVKLLDDRNEKWIIQMVDQMPEQATLFAVGAGHLAGEKGVIQLLRDQGFTVTAVLK
ncbi:TraB/GumN family protein [Myroides sp. WP-1]|uniref:TraB/GumN family protein n=1 Tax=Myroides sp. WP-1 TaxID=2759944 RepID=UPI0015F933B1|nr:TraB/GumN family protein [Myroides sp. WP-1]MBB1140326.1 TraB/GumN family protein [Myroides sp. WP-1]